MKEMFSKILSFLIGFCSKLFGKDYNKKRETHVVCNNIILGGIKMTIYCNTKSEILTELRKQKWVDLRIQHPDWTAEERFIPYHEETGKGVEDYVDKIEDGDALIVFTEDEDYNSIIKNPEAVDPKYLIDEQGGKE